MPSWSTARRRFSAVVLACAVALAAVALSPTTSAGIGPDQGRERPDRGPRVDHVVFVAWDGFDVEYLRGARTPNLDRLARRGSLTRSTGVMTSITNPSWSSVATGAWPERHLNTAYWYDAQAGVARSQQRDLAVPTIAQSIRAEGGTVASVQWFTLQNYGVTFGDPQGLYTQPGGTCERRFDDAVSIVKGEPVDSNGTAVTVEEMPELLAVYCDDLDALGHAGGDINPAIPSTLTAMDAQLGRLVAELKAAGIFRRTAIVLTGDHGMTTFDKAFGAEVLASIADAGYTAEILGSGASPAPGTDAAIVVGGVGSLHLVGDAADDPRAARRIEAALRRLPQVRAVYDERDQRRMHMSPHHGELLIEPRPGWSLGTSAPATPAGRHGATTELRVPLLLSGAGIRRHREPVRPRHIDVAPTIAALLDIDPPAGVQGRVLKESLG